MKSRNNQVDRISCLESLFSPIVCIVLSLICIIFGSILLLLFYYIVPNQSTFLHAIGPIFLASGLLIFGKTLYTEFYRYSTYSVRSSNPNYKSKRLESNDNSNRASFSSYAQRTSTLETNISTMSYQSRRPLRHQHQPPRSLGSGVSSVIPPSSIVQSEHESSAIGSPMYFPVMSTSDIPSEDSKYPSVFSLPIDPHNHNWYATSSSNQPKRFELPPLKPGDVSSISDYNLQPIKG